MPDISVVICAHNPRSEYLERVLSALQHQTLPKDRWELLVIDNASSVPLASTRDLSWHPNARHVLESELGLAPARRRGGQESRTDLLVFVDDDNVLDQGYLLEVLRIARDWPTLGVWGSGSIAPDFEVEPADYLRRYLNYLALRDLSTPRWSNVSSCFDAMPVGAGLCVRREVAAEYKQLYDQSLVPIIGRQGKNLFGGEDDEICFVSCNLGLGMGVFPELKIRHLIPKERISEPYLVRLVEGYCTTRLLLEYKWGGLTPKSPCSLAMLASAIRAVLADSRIDRRMQIARIRAVGNARNMIKNNLGRSLSPVVS